MPGFGDKLRRERERRDVPLEDIARRTRIGIQYLEALERGDFDALPGQRGFGKLYIRVYAELFGFDPEPVISEYDQERVAHERPNDAVSAVEPERPRRVRFVPRARKSPAAEGRTQLPAPRVEEPVSGRETSPAQASEPVAASVEPRREVTEASPNAVAINAAPEVISEPDLVPDVQPAEASPDAVAINTMSAVVSEPDVAANVELAEASANAVAINAAPEVVSEPDLVPDVQPAEASPNAVAINAAPEVISEPDLAADVEPAEASPNAVAINAAPEVISEPDLMPDVQPAEASPNAVAIDTVSAVVSEPDLVPDVGPAGPLADAVASNSAPAVLSDPDMVPDLDPPEPPVPSVALTGPPMTLRSPSWKLRIVGGVALLVVLGAFGITLKIRRSQPVHPSVAEPPAAATLTTPATDPRSEKGDAGMEEVVDGNPGVHAPSAIPQAKPTAPVSHDVAPGSTARAVGTPRPAVSSHLEVEEFELGTHVVNHRMLDVRREFEEGTVATFLTRVLGGSPGQVIRHTWFREGRPVQTIKLQIGSPDWHTYSKKTLWGTGRWAVEARDDSGRTLARIEFRCLPASGPGRGR